MYIYKNEHNRQQTDDWLWDTISNSYNFNFQDRMTDMRSQSIPKGLIAPIDDEICDQVLHTRPYYVRSLGYGITAISSSRSSRVDIHTVCVARLIEM